jgi:hypothetical protein
MSQPLKQVPGVVRLKRPRLIAVKAGKPPELLPTLSWLRQTPEIPGKLMLTVRKNLLGLIAAVVGKQFSRTRLYRLVLPNRKNYLRWLRLTRVNHLLLNYRIF